MTNAREFAQLIEILKQKVQAKAPKIRRYEGSHNKMFKEDTKKFYRNLGTKNIEAREPPSMAEGETYWKSLWGEEAQHNERAEWIRREEERKIRHIDWRPIQIKEVTCICQKLTIGNLLEMIKYKIIGLNLSQLLTGILQKTLMQ